MKNEDEMPGAGPDRRPVGFHEFVRELEAMGELDLDDDLGGPDLPERAPANLQRPA